MGVRMKIYVLDRGVYGMIVVVAKDETAARVLMKECENYVETAAIVEHPITAGLCLCNLGDM